MDKTKAGTELWDTLYIQHSIYSIVYIVQYLQQSIYSIVSIVQYIQYSMAWHSLVWNALVWYGMIWYGLVWYGLEWYGLLWFAMVFILQHQTARNAGYGFNQFGVWYWPKFVKVKTLDSYLFTGQFQLASELGPAQSQHVNVKLVIF